MALIGDWWVVDQEDVLDDLAGKYSLAIGMEGSPKLVGQIGLFCNSLEDEI